MHGQCKTVPRTPSLQLSRLSIQWSVPALVVFYRLPIRSATMIDRAIIQLAETGEGSLEWVSPYYRLRVSNFDIVLVLDTKVQTLYVVAIYRATVRSH